MTHIAPGVPARTHFRWANHFHVSMFSYLWPHHLLPRKQIVIDLHVQRTIQLCATLAVVMPITGCSGEQSAPKVDWSTLRAKASAWSSELNRSDDVVDHFTHVQDFGTVKNGETGSTQFWISTKPLIRSSEDGQLAELVGPDEWVVDHTAEEYANGFFVIPPGRFANDIDQAIDLMRQSSAEAFSPHADQ